MGFSDPIVAGTQLVRDSIASPNFAAGVSGWIIRRDGTAEFADAVIRGTVEAAGGTVVLDDDGVTVSNADGSFVQLTSIPGFGAVVLLHPANVVGQVYASAFNYATTFPLQHDAPVTVLSSPYLTAPDRGYARIYLVGEDTAGNPPTIDLRSTGDVRVLDGDLVVSHNIEDVNGIRFARVQTGVAPVSFAAAVQNVHAVSFPITFPSAPVVHTNINSGAGVTAQWTSRAINITTTGFDIFTFATGAGAPVVWTNIPVGWSATIA